MHVIEPQRLQDSESVGILLKVFITQLFNSVQTLPGLSRADASISR